MHQKIIQKHGKKEENELAKLDNNINNIINNEEILEGTNKPEPPQLPNNTSNLYLYYKGYINEEITGDINTIYSPAGDNPNAGKIIIGKEYIELKTWSHWILYQLSTEKQIDVTDYSKIRFEIFDSNWIDNSAAERCVLKCGGKEIDLLRDDIKDGIYEIDITDISGSTSVEASVCNGASIKIRAIWLEKQSKKFIKLLEYL